MPTADTPRPDLAGLRATVTELAALDRAPTSPGEHQAASIICDWLTERGCRSRVEHEDATASYAWPVGAMTALATIGGLAAGRRGRAPALIGTLAGLAATAGIADDISYGPHLARRALSPRRTAANVVAECGDPAGGRTLVVTVHHDAAPTGAVFDQRMQRAFAARYPHLIARIKQNPPMWWPVVAGPALVALGSALRRPGIRRAGLVTSLIATVALADIGRHRGAVPGANDNLSGVAVLVALAKALAQRPIPGLRVLLVSAGAEEALQEGIRGFAGRHFAALPTDSTYFLNLDTVGSGNLVLLDGEGPLWMEDYSTEFGDLIARCASTHGVAVKRGLRSRNSTDGVVPNRYGYPTGCLVSVDDDKLLPHYHLPSDLPEHVDYDCVADAAVLAEAVARELAVPPAGG